MSGMIRAYDFFGGCGGASCGFKAAGMDIAFSLDNDTAAIETFRANFPDAHHELTDIRKFDPEVLRLILKKDSGHPVLFSGCAPCQPFSKQVTRRSTEEKDRRVFLLITFSNLIRGFRPDVVFAENVPGVRGSIWEYFVSSLKESGYQVDYRLIKMKEYGIPQIRQRLVLVGSLHGRICLPEKPSEQGDSTVRDWIEGLPPIRAGETHPTIPNHRAARLSPLNLERIRATPEGGGNRDWPQRLELACHAGLSGYSDSWGRLSWDKPAPTLTTRCVSYSNGRYGHPEQDRAISVREAACLQTFPRDFVFRGSLADMARQIGNAVPVRFAELVGQCLAKHLGVTTRH